MGGFARFVAAAVLAACCAGAAMAQGARDVLVLEINPDTLRAEIMRVAEQQGGDALVPDETEGKPHAAAVKRHDLPADQVAAIGRPRFESRVEGDTLELGLIGAPAAAQGVERVRSALPGFALSLRADGKIVAVLTPEGFADRLESAAAVSRTVLARRLEAAGVDGATVERAQGSRLEVSARAGDLSGDVVELMQARGMVGWHRVDSTYDTGGSNAPVVAPHGLKVMPDASEDGLWRVIEVRPLIYSDEIARASAEVDTYGLPGISFVLTDSGRLKFAEATRKLMGSAFAIVLDDRILSAPTIESEITSGVGQITGSFTVEQARMLAAEIAGGVLPVRLELVERRTGPSR